MQHILILVAILTLNVGCETYSARQDRERAEVEIEVKALSKAYDQKQAEKREARLNEHRQIMIPLFAGCRNGDAEVCIKAAIVKADRADWETARDFAKKACYLGHKGGCKLVENLPQLEIEDNARQRRINDEMQRENEIALRERERDKENAERQSNNEMMLGIMAVSNQMERTNAQPVQAVQSVSPFPKQTRCVSRWEYDRQVTVCE